jgi:Integral membrane protein possibly involved in chromosome condensation
MTFAIESCFDSADNVCPETSYRLLWADVFILTEEDVFLKRSVLNYIYLVLFGMLGAVARYAVELLIHTGSFPLATLIINVTGCFLLAFIVQFLIWMPWLSAQTITLMGTGFVGSFTTFSTFALESAQLIRIHPLIAISYILASVIGGLLAAILGYRTSKLLLIRFKGAFRHGR